MDSLLYKLYSGDYDFSPRYDEKQHKLEDKLFMEWDKVQAAFGSEFIDRLLALEGERDDWYAFRCYREGFRLGVRLMLEALTSATG